MVLVTAFWGGLLQYVQFADGSAWGKELAAHDAFAGECAREGTADFRVRY